MATPELTRQLETIFEELPYERISLDLVRGLRWGLDAGKEARLRCITKPTGIETSSGKVMGEAEYPRQYVADLAFPHPDDSLSVCVAQSLWFVSDQNTELKKRKWALRRFDADLGIDSFDLVDLGDPNPNPAKDVVITLPGFIKPDILDLDGVRELVDTIGGSDGN